MLHITFTNVIADGFDKDTIVATNRRENINRSQPVRFNDADTILPRYKFRLIIDTSYIIPSKDFEYKNFEFPNKKFLYKNGLINGKEPTKEESQRAIKIITDYSSKHINQWDDYVSCYPLLIQNTGKKVAYINKIKVIQQAKDVDGKWKPIEFFEGLPTCVGHNYFDKFLPQKYMGIAIIKYNGNFKTKLRVKAQIGKHYYYSNEIMGHINQSQFSLAYLKKYMQFHDYGESNDKELFENEQWLLLNDGY